MRSEASSNIVVGSFGDLLQAADERRVMGVLAADLVGYSELVFRDPHTGVAVLRNSRSILVQVIRDCGGTILQTPGDFVLATFSDPGEVLKAATEAQTRLLRHYRSKGHKDSGHWRIGVEYGEVFAIDTDYYGTALNVAARLQALAGPGEIWFTGSVPGRAELPRSIVVQELGSKQLKNIARPVQVFRAYIPEYSTIASALRAKPWTPPHRLNLRKPVLLLKPFERFGSGSAARFVGQALVEEVELILSRLGNSIAVAQAKPRMQPQHDYVLSGTVQCGGPHVRIVSRLVSAADGLTLWADRFETDMRRPFDVQDQIAREIVAALQLALTEGEQAQLWRRGTASGKAWEAFQRGHDWERHYTRQGHIKAMECYTEALEIDPDYLCTIVALGFCHLDEVRLGWSADDAASLSAAEQLWKRAQELEENHPDVVALLAYIRFFQGRVAEARTAIDRAVKLAPQSPEIIAYRGALLDLMGDFDGAVRAYSHALSLAPHAPAWMAANLGLTLLALDNSFEAERVYREVIQHHPKYARAWIGLAVALVRQGRVDEATHAAETLLSLDPRFTTADWARSRPFCEDGILDRFISDLRAAGLQ